MKGHRVRNCHRCILISIRTPVILELICFDFWSAADSHKWVPIASRGLCMLFNVNSVLLVNKGGKC